MNKRFWRRFLALVLGLTLVLGTGGYMPSQGARASEAGTGDAPQQVETEQPAQSAQPAEKTDEKQPEASDTNPQPADAPEEKAPTEKKKAEKDVAYIAGGKRASAKASAGSKIPGLSALGLKVPDGKAFLCWGTTESGGTTYKAGGTFSADESKIPAKLYAHWTDAPTEAESTVPEAAPAEAPIKNEAASADGGKVTVENEVPVGNGNGGEAPVANNGDGNDNGSGSEVPATDGNGNEVAPVADGNGNEVPATSVNGSEAAPVADGNGNGNGSEAAPVANRNDNGNNNEAAPVANSNGSEAFLVADDNGSEMAPATDGNANEADPATGNNDNGNGSEMAPATDHNGTGSEATPVANSNANGGEASLTTDAASAPPEEITIIYRLGDVSASAAAVVGSALPAPDALGLAVAEDLMFYWWSPSSDGSSNDIYRSGDAVTASTPATLYAICGPAMKPKMVPVAPAFSRVRYYQTATDASYIEVTTSIQSARAYSSLGFQNQKPGEQFLCWQTAGGFQVLPDAPIDTLPATGADGAGIPYLSLYGVWQATALPALTLSQTADKPYIGRGETVTFTITVANTDGSGDAYVRLENVVDSRFTVQNYASQPVRWDLRVNHGGTATVTLTVKANENAGDGMVFNTATVIKEVRVDPALTTPMSAQLDAAPTVSSPSAALRTDVLQVVYNGNGGVFNGGSSFADNTGYRAVQSNPFTRSAATFLCWNTAADGSGTNYAPGSAIPIESVFSSAKVFTLYAKWSLPVVSIAKTTLNEAVASGQTVAYVIRVKNTSEVAANSVIVTDTLPAGLTYLSASPAAQAVGGQTLQWSVNVPAKGVATLTVNARVNAGLSPGTQIVNPAVITSIGGLTADNVNFPGSSFTASVTSTISVKKIIYHPQNGEANYEANGDNAPVALDLSATFARAGYQLTGWNALPSGTGASYAFGQSLPSFTGNEFHLYGVWASSTELHIAKTADKTVIAPGESVIFTVTVSNTGSAAALNVTVAEQPDGNLTSYADYVVNSASCSAGAYDQNTRIWTIPVLAANATATLKLAFKAKAVGSVNATLANAAQITGHTAALGVLTKAPDPAFASVNVLLNVSAGTLRVSKKISGNYANASRDFTFRLILKDAAGNALSGSAAVTTSEGIAASFPMNQPITFVLRHNQSIVFWNLPAGAQYTVEETDYHGYWPNQQAFSGTIRGDMTADFVNTRNRNTDIPKTGYGDQASQQDGRKASETAQRVQALYYGQAPAPEQTASFSFLSLFASASAEAADAPALQVADAGFAALSAQNPDVVGWLKGGENIDGPVVQRDNAYYMDHNFFGEEDRNGTLFVNASNELSPRDNVLLIHGHNMKGGDMFGKLLNFRDEAYMRQHPLVSFQLAAGEDEPWYVAIAAFDASMLKDERSYFDITQILFDDDAGFQTYLDSIQARSYWPAPVDVSVGDSLLMLITCSYEQDDGRFVLVCRQLREGETPENIL